MMAGQLGQMLHGVADTVMLGAVGVTELAASTFANTLVHPPLIVGLGLLASVSIRVSQARGANTPNVAAETLRLGLALATVGGLALLALLLALVPAFPLFRQPPEVAARAPEFFRPVALSILPVMLSIALKNYSDAMARPWIPFAILLGGVALNILLNWIMIFGNLGCPPLGLAGAAWATLVSRTIACLALASWILRTRAFAGWLPTRWLAPLPLRRARRLLALGLPISFAWLVEVAAFNFGGLMTGWLNAASLAAHQIALTCASTTFMIPLGISMATTVRVGECLGAGEKSRVRTVALSSLLAGLTLMAAAAIILSAFRHHIASWFTQDHAVRHLTARLLLIAALFQLADGFQVVAAGALRGLNDVRRPALIALSSYWLIALPLGWFAAFHLHWHAEGVWTGFAAGLAFAALTLGTRIARKTRPPTVRRTSKTA
jgi:MATE family multidrug resistance protein